MFSYKLFVTPGKIKFLLLLELSIRNITRKNLRTDVKIILILKQKILNVKNISGLIELPYEYPHNKLIEYLINWQR